jgi:hypothetical protein
MWEVAGQPSGLVYVEETTQTATQQPHQQQRPQPSVVQHRRTRSWHRVDSLADLALPLSAVETLERIITETWMVAGLAVKLFTYLGLGKHLSLWGCVWAQQHAEQLPCGLTQAGAGCTTCGAWCCSLCSYCRASHA